MSWTGLSSKQTTGRLGSGASVIEVENIFHAGDVFAIDLGNTPHVPAPGLEVVFGQASAHRLTREIIVLGKPDQFTRQQFERPASAALRWLGTGGRHQQGFLFARELAACSRARLLAQCRFQAAEHEAAFGAVDGRASDADAPRNLIVVGAGVDRQQYLRPPELARCVPAAAQKRSKITALALVEFDPIA
jgi:hypothetical protein